MTAARSQKPIVSARLDTPDRGRGARHVSRVLAKLGLVSRVQAVVFAYDIGLVSPRSGR